MKHGKRETDKRRGKDEREIEKRGENVAKEGKRGEEEGRKENEKEVKKKNR